MENVNITKLAIENKEIIVIGTNHVSSDSAKLVKQIIDTEQPDAVFIELDKKRYDKYMNPEEWENTDLIQIIKSKQFPIFMFNFLYKHFQKRMLKEESGVVGEEFIVSSNEAQNLGSRLVLIDRDAQVTFKRAWKSLTIFQRFMLPSAFLNVFDDKEMSDEDMQKLLESENFEPVFIDLKDKYPDFWTAFIAERDEYMTTKILGCLGEKNVVVVGKGHVDGLVKCIKEGKKVDLENYEKIPEPSVSERIRKWTLPIILLLVFAYAFTQSPSVGLEQLKIWIIWKGTVASIFTAFALAHPLAIITAFILAPFTTFIPFVSVGIFTALIEAKFRKPKVKDFESMDIDIKGVKSFYENRVLRIFLVFFLSNVGSILGNFLGGLDIIKNLF